MPREGVPYPQRMLCSLKCELKSIWDALNGKLHSVNGVEGDGAGNVNIVSGDAAVVVTTDPSLNQIEISLDQAQLPSAAVTSVNGETGAVVLDASDIGSDGSSDVQTDIDALKGADVTLQGNINAEATARGNADSTLQTNINACYASIPGEVSTALANSPRISAIEYNLTQAENDIDALENTRLKINDVNQYAIGLTGNQDASGIKRGNFYTYTGLPEYSTADSYTALASLGTLGASISIGFAAVTRGCISIGGIIVSSGGVPTFTGINTSGGTITLGIGMVGTNAYLVMRRTSSAGQNISLTIFGITKTNQRIDAPAGGLGAIECDSYTEAVRI